jgi:hypothetical protein
MISFSILDWRELYICFSCTCGKITQNLFSSMRVQLIDRNLYYMKKLFSTLLWAMAERKSILVHCSHLI